jgi:predicted glycoside hydrolase/deacetylase ChbG (UPF0249 family)
VTKQLIINADDFGFSDGVNRAILRAAREGVLTSTTLAANMPCAEAAASEVQDSSELGVGVHLNVVRGRPLSSADMVPWLVGPDGCFRRRFWSFCPVQFSLDPQILAQVEREYRVQIEQVLAWGIRPTHLDSERHHAAWPTLFRLMVKLAEEYGVPAVRVTREPHWPGAPKRCPKKLVQSAALRVLTLPAARICQEMGVRAPQYFYGGAHIGEVSGDYLVRLAKALPEGIHELMVHPGEPDSSTTPEARSYLDTGREGELAALLDPTARDALSAAGVDLVSFAALG